MFTISSRILPFRSRDPLVQLLLLRLFQSHLVFLDARNLLLDFTPLSFHDGALLFSFFLDSSRHSRSATARCASILAILVHSSSASFFLASASFSSAFSFSFILSSPNARSSSVLFLWTLASRLSLALAIFEASRSSLASPLVLLSSLVRMLRELWFLRMSTLSHCLASPFLSLASLRQGAEGQRRTFPRRTALRLASID